jgi:hypothetical protein
MILLPMPSLPNYASLVTGITGQYFGLFIEMGSNFLLGLGSNCDPSHLYLPSSFDYRYEPPIHSKLKAKNWEH